MNSDSSLYVDEQSPDSLDAGALSIALIGPDEDRRKAAASALAGCQAGEIHEFSTYPPSLDDVPKLLEQNFDVILIGLDSHPEYALELVESFCSRGAATVMIYSEKADAELLVRCMRAGAREFLTLPFVQATVAEALVRASARRQPTRPPKKKEEGRLLAFLGAKGGDGVTTLACNFAVSLAQESGQSTLLIDLDLPLGDAALNLGVSAEYSAINALQNFSRLDSSFLAKLLVKHSSGVSVLAAPGKFPQYEAPDEAIDKLITVARQDFDNVVIDMGSRLDLMGTSLFKDGSTIYLVIQAGIAGLRNSNRLISQYFAAGVPKLEIVLNRYQSRTLGVAEDQITKALTRPAQWKIPNDYAAVRRMQDTAIPLTLEDSPISRLIRQMARSACCLPAIPDKEAGFSLKKISRSLSSKISRSEETPVSAQFGLASGQEKTDAALDTIQPEAPVNRPENSSDTPLAGTLPVAEPRTPATPADTATRKGFPAASPEAHRASTPEQPGKPETRTYKGATYVRAADGKWHLQQAEPAAAVRQEMPVLVWPAPASIAYGAALSATELNAIASVPGKFVYTPAVGEVLAAGIHTLSVAFTPSYADGYTPEHATVSITVTRAMPEVTWRTPAPIAYGAALSAVELNAAASAPGKFVYTPGIGELLAAGVQELSVTFTPADTANYAWTQAAVSLTVAKATPIITWTAPALVSHGTALSRSQLNASALIPGTFAYTPAAGAVLAAGAHTLSVIFTPTDSMNYSETRASVSLTVPKATPIITWQAPAAVSHGTALSRSQLNASALIPGTFAYTPAAGAVLAAGAHTLSVIFTPADSTNYFEAKTSVSLIVAKAMPAIERPASAAVFVDAAVSASQLNAEFQLKPAKAAPVEAMKPVSRLTPIPERAAAPVCAEPPVEAPVKAPPKVQAKVAAKVKATAKLVKKATEEMRGEAPGSGPAKPPIETPANAPATALVPRPVIDFGAGLDLMGSVVFEDGTTVYLVMQPGSAGVPNANRLVSQFFGSSGPKPEIVLNRFEPHLHEGAEDSTGTALARRAYLPISRLIGQMVRPILELPATPVKKKLFSLRNFSRSIWAKFSTTGKAPSITQLGLEEGEESAGNAYAATQHAGAARIPGRPVYAPPAENLFAPGTQMPFTRAERETQQRVGAPAHPSGIETRVYKGSTYVRGADGQWHLQETQTSEVKKPASAIQWPMPVSTSYGAAHWAMELHTTQAQSVLAKAASVEATAPVSKAKPAQEKVPAKTSVKPPVKAAAKSVAKTVAQPAVKTKTAAPPTAKAPVKVAAKLAAKTPAQSPTKAAAPAQSKAPVQRPAPVKKQPVFELEPNVESPS